tara:strand:- start:908 stop:1984 length:1077 start_codon:yes stop_codon:yes gene_type:complete
VTWDIIKAEPRSTALGTAKGLAQAGVDFKRLLAELPEDPVKGIEALEKVGERTRLAIYSAQSRAKLGSKDQLIQKSIARDKSRSVALLKSIEAEMQKRSPDAARSWDMSTQEAEAADAKAVKELANVGKFNKATTLELLAERRYTRPDDNIFKNALSYASTPWWKAKKLSAKEIREVRDNKKLGPVVRELFTRNVAQAKTKKYKGPYSLWNNPRKVAEKAGSDNFGSLQLGQLNALKKHFAAILANPSFSARQEDTFKAADNLRDRLEKVILSRERQESAGSKLYSVEDPPKRQDLHLRDTSRGEGLPKKPRKRSKRKKKKVKQAELTPIPEEPEKPVPKRLLKKYYPRSKSASKMRI